MKPAFMYGSGMFETLPSPSLVRYRFGSRLSALDGEGGGLLDSFCAGFDG